MENTRPEPAILCNVARHPVMVLIHHQPSQKTFDPQPALLERCARAMVTPSLGEWLANDWSTWIPIAQVRAHALPFLDGRNPVVG